MGEECKICYEVEHDGRGETVGRPGAECEAPSRGLIGFLLIEETNEPYMTVSNLNLFNFIRPTTANINPKTNENLM